MRFTTTQVFRKILYVKRGKFFTIQLTTGEKVTCCFNQLKTVNGIVWIHLICCVTNEGLKSRMSLILVTCVEG